MQLISTSSIYGLISLFDEIVASRFFFETKSSLPKNDSI
jgi:hypothetical protein